MSDSQKARKTHVKAKIKGKEGENRDKDLNFREIIP
jgi:hypothetical protein